jgi:antitoxin component of MazEF toxin-antitoxin module
MIKKLSKHGNSLALLIDKPILELLSANENTEFKIKIEEGKIILEPVHIESKTTSVSENKKLQKKYEELVEKYDAVLKKLAKS